MPLCGICNAGTTEAWQCTSRSWMISGWRLRQETQHHTSRRRTMKAGSGVLWESVAHTFIIRWIRAIQCSRYWFERRRKSLSRCLASTIASTSLATKSVRSALHLCYLSETLRCKPPSHSAHGHFWWVSWIVSRLQLGDTHKAWHCFSS